MSAPDKSPVSRLCAAIDLAAISDRPTPERLITLRRRLDDVAGVLPADAPEWARHVFDGLVELARCYLAAPADGRLRRSLMSLRNAAASIDGHLAMWDKRPARDEASPWWDR